ncbi:cation:proton antiporter [Rhizobium herbae]|uniref:Multicomponent Na+:H+ antiporter subunit F n=1 Tax=Rhizobium herbae TaxID=508661 RepID=A0ABS4EPK4_9HYPH|nr:cation:proton antiporter [Rhizobium herbae]MBP1859746.1 multicomponent Na+:H+ antiporter subunit F [Rhizobium herbae]
MSASAILSFSTSFALIALSLGLLLTVARILRGPTLPDRVLGLDMLVAIAIGFIAVIAIRSGYNLYIDIAIALSLVGFLATVAFARFILARGLSPEAEKGAGEAPPAVQKARRDKPARRRHKGAR